MKACAVALGMWALHVARAASTASRISSAPSSVAINFAFNTIPDATTCTPMTFTWLAPTANSSVIRLFITNLNVPQGPYPSTAISTTISRAPSGGYQLLTRLINQSPVGVALRMWTWPAVNVTEGWYAMLAQFPSTNTFVQSSPFHVGNGSDTSCLRSASVPSVSSVSSTSTTGTSSSVSGSSSVKSGVASIPSRSTSTTGTSSSVSGSSSVKSGATSDPSRRSNINRGAIAGGAIGGLLIAIAALILVFRRFRDIPTPIPPTPFTLSKQATDVPVSRPPTTGKSVLVLDRPIAPAGVESQDAMLTKLDRMRESLRVREGQEHRAGAVAEDETPRLLFVSAGIPEATMSESTDIRNADAEPNILGVGVEEMSAPDLALQLRGMAERMTLIEARMQTQGISDERPPDYSAQSTLQ